MKNLTAACLSLSLLAAPAMAQEDDGSIRDGFDLFSEGTRMILEGLIDEMQPFLDEAQPFLEEEVAPFFAQLWDLMDDFASYELPERLPNGDIIIRRSPDAAPFEAEPEIGENGAVEL
ncbi:MAG: hypothetical protein AAF376_08105 [Pseudomonadota bacterium]